MSFWKGVMNVMGFGSDNDDENEEYDSSLPTYAAQPRTYKPKSVTAPASHQSETKKNDSELKSDTKTVETTSEKAMDKKPKPKVEATKTVDTSLPGDLFDELIALFNQAQPDFISKCISTEAQREYLYKALSEKLRRRLVESLSTSPAQTSVIEDEELSKLRKQLTALEEKAKTAESLKQENKKLQQNIGHQKRALLDRINDLEAQVAKSQAEREKIFTGKYNLADPAVVEANNARIKELEASLKEKDSQIENLKNDITKLGDTSENLSKTLAERDKQLAERDNEIAQEKQAREELLAKIAISDQMINDLHNQSATDKKEFEETCAQQFEALEEINRQVELFEQVKEKYESRIKELKVALQNAKENDNADQLVKLKEENASLRHTIENNLYNQANNESSLRNEIKQLKSELEKAQATMTAASPSEQYGSGAGNTGNATFDNGQQPQRRRGRPKKVKLDDNLDNTDWFSTQKDNSDFGYHEPPRRPSNDNANQLSLF